MATQNDKNIQSSSSGQSSAAGGNMPGESAKPIKKPNISAVPQSTTQSTSQSSGLSSSSPRSGAEGSVTDTAKSLYADAKSTAGEAYDAAAEKAVTKLDEKKADLSAGLSTVASSFRKAGETLHTDTSHAAITDFTAKYTDTAAQKIDEFASYFERKNIREMAQDVERFAKRNPAVFIGGAAVLGILAARFLKSSSPRNLNEGRSLQYGDSMNQPSNRLPQASEKEGAQSRKAAAGGRSGESII